MSVSVGISDGSFVGIAVGARVGMAVSVGISDGLFVGIAVGAKVGISVSVGISDGLFVLEVLSESYEPMYQKAVQSPEKEPASICKQLS